MIFEIIIIKIGEEYEKNTNRIMGCFSFSLIFAFVFVIVLIFNREKLAFQINTITCYNFQGEPPFRMCLTVSVEVRLF